VLPRRCALSEIANGQLVAIKVPGLSTRRQVRLVYRRGDQSHAAEAFLEVVRSTAGAAPADGDIAPATARLPQP
jgi:DNA-binding transcriptional LysR family regulator